MIYLILSILSLITFNQVVSQSNENFICSDGTEIQFSNLCNGVKDCKDGSDETKELCFHVMCPMDTFKCYYGACVKKEAKCDDNIDCADKSDESQCGKEHGSCEEYEFMCGSGECIHINDTCNGKLNCKDKSDEDKVICQEWPCPDNSFRCHKGGCIHKDFQCNNFKDCPDGSDETTLLCKSLNCKNEECDIVRKSIKCPPVISNRIIVNCEVPFGAEKGVVPCHNPMPVGTIAKYECKPTYRPANARHAYNINATCQMDGTWNRDFIKCEPECGTTETDVTALIVHGWYPKAGGWPWHAVLYTQEEGKWTFSCGGTLISEKAVLTAAHCTWKQSPENLKVAFGKYYSDFEQNEDFTVVRNVNQIIIQPLYQDISGNYGSDISVLILDEEVVFSEFIKPICIDWNSVYLKEQVTHGNLGLIVGMGVTENDTFSDNLRAIYIPVVKDDECISHQRRDFKKYITYTSFCAGWKNGTGVCNGDSGGGLVFHSPTNKNQWYLQGIVSISPRRQGTSFCDPKYYTIFTKVAIYTDWLEDVVQNIHPDRYREKYLDTNIVY